MGVYKLKCTNVVRHNNGTRQARLTSDEYGHRPLVVAWDGTLDEFAEGQDYIICVTRELPRLPEKEM